MQPGTWLHSKQRTNVGYPSKEDAARSMIAESEHDLQLHDEMNQAIVAKFIAG